MKKIITALIATLVCALAFGQSRLYCNGKIYIQGTKEYQAIDYYNKITKNCLFVPTFEDNDSFNEYMRGQDLIVGGTTTMLISSALLLGTSLIEDDVLRGAATITAGISCTIGGIFSLVGLYKSHRWRFNGGGITYTF